MTRALIRAGGNTIQKGIPVSVGIVAAIDLPLWQATRRTTHE